MTLSPFELPAHSAERMCRYNGCQTTLIPEQLFRHCEPCRRLKLANAIRFVLDPESPLLSAVEYANERQTRLTEMTGEEILRHMQLLEDEYLYVCKIVKLRGITGGARKPVKTTNEYIEEVRSNLADDFLLAREHKKAEAKAKVAKKQSSKATQLAKALGMTEQAALAWMNDTEDEGF